jgi:hypothetical protein
VPYPPININVLPAQALHASVLTTSLSGPSPLNEHLVIPGPQDVAVRDYCKWLESRVTGKTYKADFRKTCKIALAHYLDLKLIFEDPDPGFFIEQGVQKGTAQHFVHNIHKWATHVRTNLLPRGNFQEIPNDDSD